MAIRRTVAELQDSRNYYQDLLHSLLASLRSSDPNRVNQLLDLIRSSASLPDIAAATADAPVAFSGATADSTSRRSSDDMSSPQPAGSFIDSHTHVTLDMLCDIPRFQVPAKPWTAVTDDDHLISHLISLYFTWDHPFSQLVEQDIFLAEMNKGDLGSDLCAPLLVNSMLAMASVCCCQPMFCPPCPNLTPVGLLRFSKSPRHPGRHEHSRPAFLFGSGEALESRGGQGHLAQHSECDSHELRVCTPIQGCLGR